MSDLVAVAFIGGVPSTIAALAAWRAGSHSKRTLTIAKGNGKGDLAQMAANTLTRLISHEARDEVLAAGIHEAIVELNDKIGYLGRPK